MERKKERKRKRKREKEREKIYREIKIEKGREIKRWDFSFSSKYTFCTFTGGESKDGPQ